MGYVRGLGEPADTATYRALHAAALAVIAARRAGNAAAEAAARRSLEAVGASNTERAAAIREAEAAPETWLDRLRAMLTSAGKTAALVGVAVLAAPYALRALSQSAGSRRLNPGRKRRRRVRRSRRPSGRR